jgi:large subunit ribosomal protein L15
MKLNELQPALGATKDRKRVGRGKGSGNGKTAGRGEKGQKSRRGYSSKRGFEGGQMSLVRRLPKRGFTNIHALNLQELDLDYISAHFGEGETVCLESMRDKKLLKSAANGIVVLNNGELTRKVTIVADRISKGAREAILAAGGTIQEPPCSKQAAK